MKAIGPAASNRPPHRCSPSPSTEKCTAMNISTGSKAVMAAAMPASEGPMARASGSRLPPAKLILQHQGLARGLDTAFMLLHAELATRLTQNAA